MRNAECGTRNDNIALAARSFRTSRSALRTRSAFTLIEIAICLAIIGFALVAIIGVLPIGMSAQRVNREQTVINQDASVLMEAIRGGAHGLDYLTNYVYAITNYRAVYTGGFSASSTVGWTTGPGGYLSSGADIIGILSTPQFTDNTGNPLAFLPNTGYSNHVIAYVRSISGLAAEKPPQDNQIMREDTFTYRLYCVNAPGAVPLGSPVGSFGGQLLGNQRELRLTFLWPQLPNGKVGGGHQTYRATIAGQLSRTNGFFYYYQPQSFTNTP